MGILLKINLEGGKKTEQKPHQHCPDTTLLLIVCPLMTRALAAGHSSPAGGSDRNALPSSSGPVPPSGQMCPVSLPGTGGRWPPCRAASSRLQPSSLGQMSRRWQLGGRWGAEKACFIHFHQEFLFEISESFIFIHGREKTVKLKKTFGFQSMSQYHTATLCW